MATLPEVPSSESLLQSRLQVYEKEILELKQQLQAQQTDANEARQSLQKITNEFKLERENCASIKKENEDLKAKIVNFSQGEESVKKKLDDAEFAHKQTTIRAEESEKELHAKIEECSELKKELQTLKEKNSQSVTELNKSHAKEIGKIRNEQSLILEERINNFAKSENALKAEIAQLNQRGELMDREYKDTIASQAQRLVAYEQQLNLMEKEMGRLRIQNDYAKMPKFNNEGRELNRLKNENTSLKTDNSQKTQQIADLINRLNMVRLNAHHDFRDTATRF